MFNKQLRQWIFIISLIIFIGLIFLNFNYFEKYISSFIESHLSNWGLLGFFIIIFLLESVPQPFISALAILFTGSLLGFDFLTLFYITITGGIFANYVAYFLGLSLGNSTVGLFINQNNYEKSVIWFNKYGKKTISLLALTPLPYFPIIGGIFKMSLKEFTTYAIIPRIIHFLIFGGLLTLFI